MSKLITFIKSHPKISSAAGIAGLLAVIGIGYASCSAKKSPSNTSAQTASSQTQTNLDQSQQTSSQTSTNLDQSQTASSQTQTNSYQQPTVTTNGFEMKSQEFYSDWNMRNTQFGKWNNKHFKFNLEQIRFPNGEIAYGVTNRFANTNELSFMLTSATDTNTSLTFDQDTGNTRLYSPTNFIPTLTHKKDGSIATEIIITPKTKGKSRAIRHDLEPSRNLDYHVAEMSNLMIEFDLEKPIKIGGTNYLRINDDTMTNCPFIERGLYIFADKGNSLTITPQGNLVIKNKFGVYKTTPVSISDYVARENRSQDSQTNSQDSAASGSLVR